MTDYSGYGFVRELEARAERAEARVTELEGLLYAALPYTPDALRAAIREALGEAPETGGTE